MLTSATTENGYYLQMRNEMLGHYHKRQRIKRNGFLSRELNCLSVISSPKLPHQLTMWFVHLAMNLFMYLLALRCLDCVFPSLGQIWRGCTEEIFTMSITASEVSGHPGQRWSAGWDTPASQRLTFASVLLHTKHWRRSKDLPVFYIMALYFYLPKDATIPNMFSGIVLYSIPHKLTPYIWNASFKPPTVSAGEYLGF